MISDEKAAEIDAISNWLIEDCKEHWKEYHALHPEADRRLVFEGWIIQKVAACMHQLGLRIDPM